MQQRYAYFIALFLILFIHGTAWSEEQPGLPPQIYMKLEPPFVVNVEDGDVVRFLQVNAELQYSDATAQPLIEKHMDAIRHTMVMLLSGQPTKVLKTAKGKEDLRLNAQKEIQKLLTEYAGKPLIEAIYFTGFIIQ